MEYLFTECTEFDLCVSNMMENVCVCGGGYGGQVASMLGLWLKYHRLKWKWLSYSKYQLHIGKNNWFEENRVILQPKYPHVYIQLTNMKHHWINFYFWRWHILNCSVFSINLKQFYVSSHNEGVMFTVLSFNYVVWFFSSLFLSFSFFFFLWGSSYVPQH